MDTGPSAIGRYQVRARLGQGGMGVLYLALDPAIDRLIAVKLLRAVDDELRERFLREARLAARLQHPNIVTIYDVGSHDGQPFIAMEYIAGETLAELIQRKAPLALLRKLELALDACQGLAYAHKNGIVHRDIKPANLMVSRENGVLKVLDFGIARGADSTLTQIGMLMGTPNYMAPEQIEGKPIDQRADIFAVGLVLYELLVYRQAFKAETPHAVLHQVLHASPKPLRELDAGLDAALITIVEHAIAKDPAKRYNELERLRADLVRVVQRLKTEVDADTVAVPAADVEAARQGGRRELDRQRLAERRAAQIATHLAAAEAALQSNDADAALAAAESAALLAPEDAKVVAAMDRAKTAIEAREIAAFMSAAREHMLAGEMTEAGEAVMEALQIDPRHADAQSLRIQIDRAVEERERARERARAVARALAQAEQSLAAGALDAALRATGEALGHDPSSAEAQTARAKVLALVDRQAERAIAAAREHFAAERHAQAIHVLEEFSPWHEGVETELTTLKQEITALLQRRREEEEARQRAEEEARRKAEEEARLKAEEEVRIAREAERAIAVAREHFDADRHAEAVRVLEEFSPRTGRVETELAALKRDIAAVLQRRREEEEARQRAEAEARRKAEEEARRKAEEEARIAREAEQAIAAAREHFDADRHAEAVRVLEKFSPRTERVETELATLKRDIAAVQQRRREEEEARQRAEEEARRKAEEARQKAEEEARIAREADRAIATARKHFAADRHAEAVRALEAFLPRHERVETELVTLKRDIAVVQQRRREEEEARQRAEADARRKADEEARRKAEEEARRRREAEEASQRAQAEARRKAEAEARQRAEEEARLKAAEEARLAREAEEARKRAAEEKARQDREAAEARKRAEAEARRKAEEEARLAREAEEARKLAEEEARRKAKEDALLKAEEEARLVREAAEARQRAEEEARLEAEESARRAREAEAEAARKRAEDEARRKREADAQRAREADEARKAAEAQAARLREEETARKKAEEARLTREAEDARKRAEERAARLKEAEETRKRADEEARRLREAEEARLLAEAQALKQREEEAAREREEETARQPAALGAQARSEAEARKAAEDEARQPGKQDTRKRAGEEWKRKPGGKAAAKAAQKAAAEKAAADKALADKAAADSAAREREAAAAAAAASRSVLASTEDEDTHVGAAKAAADAADEATQRVAVPESIRRAAAAATTAGASASASSARAARDRQEREAAHRPPPSPSPDAGAGAGASSNTILYGGIGAAALLVIAIVGWFTLGGSNPPPETQKQGTQVADGTLKPPNPPGTPGGTGPGSTSPGANPGAGPGTPDSTSNPSTAVTPGTANPPTSTESPVTPPSTTDPSNTAKPDAPPTPSGDTNAVDPNAAANAAAAREKAIDGVVNDVRRMIDRRQRQQAVDVLGQNLMTYQNAPKLQALLTEVVNAAQRDADRARTDALRARAAERAVPELQRADNTLRESAQMRQRNRQVDAARSYWRAHDEFVEAGRLAATRPTTLPTTPVTTQANNQPPPTQQQPPPTQQNPPVTPRVDPPPAQVKPEQPPVRAEQPPQLRSENAQPPAADSRGAIQQALNRYAAAHASLSAAQVAAVWRTMNARQLRSLDEGFRQQNSHTVSLSNCAIKDNGNRASAQCTLRREIAFKNGQRFDRSNAVTFDLEKRGNDWVIIGVNARD